MKELWHWIALAGAAIAAVFGASWAKKKLEDHGAEKQRKKQEKLADETEKAIEKKDEEIDAETDQSAAVIRQKRADQEAAIAVKLGRAPTRDEVQRLIDESKE